MIVHGERLGSYMPVIDRNGLIFMGKRDYMEVGDQGENCVITTGLAKDASSASW